MYMRIHMEIEKVTHSIRLQYTYLNMKSLKKEKRTESVVVVVITFYYFSSLFS